jgi:hypothetical protein
VVWVVRASFVAVLLVLALGHRCSVTASWFTSDKTCRERHATPWLVESLDIDCDRLLRAVMEAFVTDSLQRPVAGRPPQRALARIVERSHLDCRKPLVPLSSFHPCHQTALQWAPGVGRAIVHPPGYMDKAPRFAGLCTVKRCNGSARCPVAHTAPNGVSTAEALIAAG